MRILVTSLAVTAATLLTSGLARATGGLSEAQFPKLSEVNVRTGCSEVPFKPKGGKQRSALLIGNQAYSAMPQLVTPVTDVHEVGSQLALMGVRVIVCENLEQHDMFTAVTVYDRKARSEFKSEVTLYYFAGHGASHENRTVLFGTDAVLEDPVTYAHTEFQHIVNMLDPDRNSAKFPSPRLASLLVVDACRTSTKGFLGPTAGGLNPVTTPSGSYVIYSTAPGTVASDVSNNHRNSPFAQRFLDRLKAEPGAEVDLLFRGVRSAVKVDTRNLQIPWTAHSLVGPVTLQG